LRELLQKIENALRSSHLVLEQPAVTRLRAPLLSIVAGLAGLVAGLVAAPAAAQQKGGSQAIPVVEVEGEGETGAERPAAPDERMGHVYFGAGGTAMGPSGSMGPNTPSTTLASAGFGAFGFFGVGISRHATVQIFGDYTQFLSPAACPSGCGGRGYSIGLGFTYHLLQGVAFDPWGSFGIAYRDSLFNIVNPTNPEGDRIAQHYRGIDVARIAFGGDFYPTPAFGFGPWIELDLGTNFNWPTPLLELPPDVTNTPRTYALFQVGFRVAFDPMRKAAARPSAPASAAGPAAASPGY
jgi:hypothetical protein